MSMGCRIGPRRCMRRNLRSPPAPVADAASPSPAPPELRRGRCIQVKRLNHQDLAPLVAGVACRWPPILQSRARSDMSRLSATACGPGWSGARARQRAPAQPPVSGDRIHNRHHAWLSWPALSVEERSWLPAAHPVDEFAGARPGVIRADDPRPVLASSGVTGWITSIRCPPDRILTVDQTQPTTRPKYMS